MSTLLKPLSLLILLLEPWSILVQLAVASFCNTKTNSLWECRLVVWQLIFVYFFVYFWLLLSCADMWRHSICFHLYLCSQGTHLLSVTGVLLSSLPVNDADHRNFVTQTAPRQRAQLSGVSPQSCRRARVLVVCDIWGDEHERKCIAAARLHVPLIIFLLNQLS